MTDRELLEAAADAAGVASDGLGGCYDMEREAAWNPLEDDGDALRLAVKLGISIEVHHDSAQPKAWLRVVYFSTCWVHAMVDEYEKEPYAATRRAIVRAAAEIGRAKP